LTTLDGATLPNSMLDSLKTVLHAGKMPECFWVVKSTSRFFRRPPSVNNPESCRKVSRPPEVSVPPKKQRLLASKFGFGRLRRALFLTQLKSSMETRSKPGKRNCKRLKTGQIELKDF
jgi:hypothetical protein